jgi:hypothetical protein
VAVRVRSGSVTGVHISAPLAEELFRTARAGTSVRGVADETLGGVTRPWWLPDAHTAASASVTGRASQLPPRSSAMNGTHSSGKASV